MDDNQTSAIILAERPIESSTPPLSTQTTTSKRSLFRTLTRLGIGVLMTGASGLARRLQIWEDQAINNVETERANQETVEPGIYPTTSQQDESHTLGNYQDPITSPDKTQTESSADLLRYAIVGMVFETQDQVSKALHLGGRLTRTIGRMTSPFLQPIRYSRIVSPVKNQFNRLVNRGELEVQQWIETGRQEVVHSQKLADIAIYDSVDYWIDYFAENPEVVELVTSQSVSFAEEIVEEVRERTVSADNLLESIFRTIFRQPARVELPPPPPEAQRDVLQPRRHSRRF